MNNYYTDLALDKEIGKNNNKILNKNNIKVVRNKHYTTIFFNNFNDLDYILSKELKRYLKSVSNEKILVIGLGNSNSTPDALGPSTIDKILVTGKTNIDGFSNVCCFSPNVFANTGIDSIQIIKSLVKEIKATKLIIIDSLKTNNIDNLVKTIQITDIGISPGSGINSNRSEINKKNIGCEVIALGIPTVIDIRSMLKEELKDNYIVTPTNIDYLIDRLSLILANGINISLHKNFIRQKTNK